MESCRAAGPIPTTRRGQVHMIFLACVPLCLIRARHTHTSYTRVSTCKPAYCVLPWRVQTTPRVPSRDLSRRQARGRNWPARPSRESQNEKHPSRASKSSQRQGVSKSTPLRPQAAIRLAPCLPGSGDGQPQAPVGRITSSDIPQTPVSNASVTWPLRCTPAALCAPQHPGPQHSTQHPSAPQVHKSTTPFAGRSGQRANLPVCRTPKFFPLDDRDTLTLHTSHFAIPPPTFPTSQHSFPGIFARRPALYYHRRAIAFTSSAPFSARPPLRDGPSLDPFLSRYVMESIPMLRPISHQPSAHSPRPRPLPGPSQLRRLLFV